MEFGKLDSVDGVDFSMPLDPPQTLKTLQHRAGIGKLHFGLTAWADSSYLGTIYPSWAKSKNFLELYAKIFNTVEMNSTHYGIPSRQQVLKWKTKVPDDFKFCPKIPQSISHREDLAVFSSDIKEYIFSIEHFGENLGVQFLQLPPDFTIENIATLEKFASLWPDHLPLAIEFRHPSWLVSNATWELLHKANLGTVITDVAGRRDACHMVLTSSYVVVRFVGNSLHKSDWSRVEDWIKRINAWSKSNIDIYFMLHQPDATSLVHLASHMTKSLIDQGYNLQKVVPIEIVTQLKLF